ncbi:MAG: SCO family protein [Pseudomonadota bacterium]
MFFKVVIALLALTIGLYVQQALKGPGELPELQKAIILPTPKKITSFTFIDHNNEQFSNQNLLGHWTIAFFGFTNCPDICPTTMQTLKQIKARLVEQDEWGNYQVLMVSVDPARDTPEQLKKYVPFFDPEFIGMTGDVEELTEFAKQLGVLFIAREADEYGAYDVDHSAAMILFNPKGEMAGVISAPHKLEEISADLITLANYYHDDHSANASAVAAAHQRNKPLVSADSTRSNELIFEQAWIRPAPPNAKSMAGYFNIRNTSDQDIVIVASESPQFDMVMIHDTLIEGGIASMQHRDELRVPANGRFSLEPMSTHMMLVTPEREMPAGSLIDVNLISEDGRIFSQQIEVRPQPE